MNINFAMQFSRQVADSARLARLRKTVDKDVRKAVVSVQEKMELA